MSENDAVHWIKTKCPAQALVDIRDRLWSPANVSNHMRDAGAPDEFLSPQSIHAVIEYLKTNAA